jgi:hypothetical protein
MPVAPVCASIKAFGAVGGGIQRFAPVASNAVLKANATFTNLTYPLGSA